MANMWVPSLAPGQRTLPSAYRTAPGAYFAQRRMANGVAGLFGLGQDDSDEYSGDSDDDTSGDDTIDPGIVIPVDGDTVAGGPGYSAGIPDGTVAYSPGSSVTIGPGATNQDTANGITLGFPEITNTTATALATYVASSSVNGGQPTVVAANASTPAAPSGYQWATLINAAGQNLAKVLTIAQGGSSVTLPNGTQLLYGSNASAATAAASAATTLTSVLSNPTLLLVGGGVLLFMLLSKK